MRQHHLLSRRGGKGLSKRHITPLKSFNWIGGKFNFSSGFYNFCNATMETAASMSHGF